MAGETSSVYWSLECKQ